MTFVRLILTTILARPLRLGLTVCAVALAVSLVVSVTSGYASMGGAIRLVFNRFFGAADATLARGHDSRGGIDAALADALRGDPDAASVIARLEMDSGLLDAEGRPSAGLRVRIAGVEIEHDAQIAELKVLEGAWFGADGGDLAAIDQQVAASMGLKVGDAFALPGVDKRLPLRVAAIVHKPGIVARLQQTVYLPLATLQAFVQPGKAPRVTRVQIDLRDGADLDAFAARWRERLAAVDPAMELRLTRERRAEVDRNLHGITLMSYLGGGVSLLAATFIIFSTLSMGVTERQRVLAMMRAVGASRGHLAGIVLVEALLLSGVGVLLGVPLGILWVHLLDLAMERIFLAGVTVSGGGVLYAAGGCVGAALAAGLLPAWNAMRVDPLEALSPMARPPAAAMPWACAVAGLLLTPLDSLLVFGRWSQWMGGGDAAEALGRQISFFGHFALGLPALMLGFFLLSPLFVHAVERLLGPAVAGLMGVRVALLRQQLSGGVWRSAGTAAALMVGLSVLVVMQTHGRTMMGGWRLPTTFPDIFLVSFKPGGLDEQEQQKLAAVEGLAADSLLPIAIASPELGNSIFSVAGAAVMPDATMFFGFDARRGLPMMGLEFHDGSVEQAMELLRRPRHILVTREFMQRRGLRTGDALTLQTPRAGRVDYTIAGVVNSPGLDVIVNLNEMDRIFEQRTVASVFGRLEDARDDFGVRGIYMFAANLAPGVSRDGLLERIQRDVRAWGMQAGDIRHIKSMIEQVFGRLLMLAGTVAWAAMAVASLGVVNTIVASVRSRTWQFGILRSVGVTRGMLARLILAESALLGLIGALLGLGCGLLMAINARQMVNLLIGYHPPLVVPWTVLLAAFGIVVAVSVAAGAAPAVAAARRAPLELLEAGRAAM